MKPRKPNLLAEQLGWTVHNIEYLHQSPFGSMRQDEVEIHGKKFTYSYLEHPGAVFSVGLTPAGEFIVIRIFRYTLDEWCWEIPSGGLGDKPLNSILQIAQEELEEEAGYASSNWVPLGSYWSANGVAKLKVHYFLALDCYAKSAHPEVSEQISKVELVPAQEITKWILSGKMNDGDSAFASLLAIEKLKLLGKC